MTIRRLLPGKTKWYSALLLLLRLHVHGGVIVQDQYNMGWNIYVHPVAIGQTFTAEDPKISAIGVRVEPFTSRIQPSSILSCDLRQRAGATGELVTTSTTFVPPGFTGYVYFDFSTTTLTVGNQYTFILRADTNAFGVDGNNFMLIDGTPEPGRIDYTGGTAILSGQLSPRFDLTFRVFPLRQDVRFWAINSSITNAHMWICGPTGAVYSVESSTNLSDWQAQQP